MRIPWYVWAFLLLVVIGLELLMALNLGLMHGQEQAKDMERSSFCGRCEAINYSVSECFGCRV